MDTARDHYAILEVSPDATHQQIKKAYRAQALVCHPDRGGSPSRMRRVNEAWAILGDAEARRHYDTERNLSLRGSAPRTPTARGQTAPPANQRQQGTRRISYLNILIRTAAYWAGWAIRRLIGMVSRLVGGKA